MKSVADFNKKFNSSEDLLEEIWRMLEEQANENSVKQKLDLYLNIYRESLDDCEEIKKTESCLEPFFNEIIKSDYSDAKDFFLMHVEIFTIC